MNAPIRLRFIRCQLAALWLATPVLTRAQTAITTEPFSYTSGGTIAGASGGAGWSQAWQGGDITLGSGSLTFPAHASGGLAGTATGNRLDYAAASGAQDYSARQLTAPINFAQDGVYYSSVLQRKSAEGGSAPNTDQVVVKFFNTMGTLRWGFGLGSDEKFTIDGDAGGANPTWTASLSGVSLNTTYFLVSKLVTSASGSDQWFLSVYGPTETVPTNEPATWLLSFSGASDATDIDVVRMEFGSNATGAIDELRIGSSWASVTTAIPEPATYAALFGLGACLAVAWRRRALGFAAWPHR